MNVFDSLYSLLGNTDGVTVEKDEEESRHRLIASTDNETLLTVIEPGPVEDSELVNPNLLKALPYSMSKGASQICLSVFVRVLASASMNVLVQDVIEGKNDLTFDVVLYLDGGGRQALRCSVNIDHTDYLDNLNEIEQAIIQHKAFATEMHLQLEEAGFALGDVPKLRDGFIAYLHALPVSLFLTSTLKHGKSKKGSIVLFYKNNGVTYTVKLSKTQPEGQIVPRNQVALWKYSAPLKTAFNVLAAGLDVYYDDETHGVTVASFCENGYTIALLSELEHTRD